MTTGEGCRWRSPSRDAAAYFDWYRIETWRAYDRPESTRSPATRPTTTSVAPRVSAGMWEGVRYQVYEAADGHVLFMASEQAFWKNFCAGHRPDGPVREVARLEVRRSRQGQRRAAGRAARRSSAERTCSEWIDVRRRAQHDDRPGQHAADDRRRPAVPGPRSPGSRPSSSAPSSCRSRSTSRARSCRSPPRRRPPVSTPTTCCRRTRLRRGADRRDPRLGRARLTQRRTLPRAPAASGGGCRLHQLDPGAIGIGEEDEFDPELLAGGGQHRPTDRLQRSDRGLEVVDPEREVGQPERAA